MKEQNSRNITNTFDKILPDFFRTVGLEKSCKMKIGKIGFDTNKNDPSKLPMAENEKTKY